MGSEGLKIPCLKFCGLKEGSEEWREMSKKVKDACESHGCFIMVYDKIPKGLCHHMSLFIKELFDLPEETKRKHTSPKPYNGYNSDSPVYQCFGLEDASLLQTSQAFTNLMWPQGNPTFWYNISRFNLFLLRFIECSVYLKSSVKLPFSCNFLEKLKKMDKSC